MKNIKNISLLGATGSIGDSTIKVISANPDKLKLVGIAAFSNWKKLAKIANEYNVKEVCIYNKNAYEEAKNSGEFASDVHLSCSDEGLIRLSTLENADMIVAAIVGTVSLKPAMAAIEAKKDIALANKEILVLAGEFIMRAAKENGVNILPLDSEHNAIFQCLRAGEKKEVSKIILTASGGMFRDYSLKQMKDITPKQAMKNPNWDMGVKVTIDSSTLANKGLELIEARWLFDAEPENIQVVVHRQSLIHSMVEFIDGSVIAQICPPDMSFPAQNCLFFPHRMPASSQRLDWSKTMTMDFSAPDTERFPNLKLAYYALKQGKCAPAIFNASNEVAVQNFIDKKIGFLDIPKVISSSLENVKNPKPNSLDDLLIVDNNARIYAQQFCNEIAK